MLIIANHLRDANELKVLLEKKFHIVDLGVVNKILRMEIQKDRSSRKLGLP